MAGQSKVMCTAITLKGICVQTSDAGGTNAFPFHHSYETNLPVHLAASGLSRAGYRRLATATDKIVVQVGHVVNADVEEARAAIRRVAGC